MACRRFLALAALGGLAARARSQAIRKVFVTGSDPAVAVTDGAYELVDVSHNGKQCYKKERANLWLCYDAHGLWSFQPQGYLGTTQGLMVGTKKGAGSPAEAGPWRVWKDGDWRPTAVVVAASALQGPGSGGSALTLDLLVRRTVAGTMLAFGLMVTLMGTMVSSSDEHMRAYCYRLFSSFLSFLVALLVTEAVWDLLMRQLLPAPFPKGLGIAVSLPGKIMVGLLLLVGCNVAMTLVGWKVQYRRVRLMVIKILGGHITGIVGIMLFSHVQSWVAFGLADVFKDALQPDVVRVVAVFLTIGLAWFTIGGFGLAGASVREDFLREPPASPWGAAQSQPRVEGGHDRSCFAVAQTIQLAFTTTNPWGQFVDDAEDEAATVAVGFLISQAIMFCNTGQLPGFAEHYRHDDQDRAIVFFLVAALALFLLFFSIFVVRCRFGDGGRPAKVLQRSIAVATTWLLYRAVCWNIRSMLVGNRPLALLAAATLVTVLCLVCVALIDKALRVLLTRTSSYFRQWFSLFEDEHSLTEETMRAVNSCFGLVMALAWHLNFQSAVQTVVQSQEFLADHTVVAQSVIAVLLGVAFAFPWRRVVLPKSEMKESAWAAEIEHELFQLDRADNFHP